MEANKDGGTSVGFSNVKSNRIEKDLFVDFPVKVCEHEWVDSLYFNLEYEKEVQMCRKCRIPKPPIDFKISENLSQINKQQWEDIHKKWLKNPDNEIGFLAWLKKNYHAPEKK